MGDTNQLSFRDSTNEDCDLLLSTGTVHWEWFYGWHSAFAHYFPKYLQTTDSCIRAFFATNVPYNFPTDVVWGDFYQALEDKLFVFRPREWRGNNDANAPPFSGQNYLRSFKIISFSCFDMKLTFFHQLVRRTWRQRSPTTPPAPSPTSTSLATVA